MEFHDVAHRVDEVGVRLTDAGARLAVAHLAPADLGVGAPGGLGELGRALHHQAQAAFVSRSREAAALGAAASALATNVVHAVEAYQAIESRRGGS